MGDYPEMGKFTPRADPKGNGPIFQSIFTGNPRYLWNNA